MMKLWKAWYNGNLAQQFIALAEGMPGDHIHYDEHNSLEEGSSEMIVERIK